ncbi:DUF1345 domain-containing protein [Leifsonia sp. F6_8S_P_1B]|uniref:DUF1345 domain-containing protein n=1 Tax=Leifsonia williamsii TaxID=3035919 RepID=A0ABT8KB46_9MICO|nr:DUF1345 domain-containing protein [Leifsonia williamsii]MDN4614651.1 DUF1345 domain-containing protein [Leifsonia williamsii]
MSTVATARRPRVVLGLVASLAAQLAMIAVGLWAVVLEEDAENTIGLLATWCAIGTVYEIVVLIVLGRAARRPATDVGRPSRFEVGRLARTVSMTATILASLIGFTAALQVLGLHNDPQIGSLIDLVGVWSMLLAWGFLHWGFAQIYYQRYYSAEEPMLRFPAPVAAPAPAPRFVDFVYFAFTLGTTFAASDVEVLTSRARWTVVWHSVLSYFFNGLIIVLALNTIMSVGR